MKTKTSLLFAFIFLYNSFTIGACDKKDKIYDEWEVVNTTHEIQGNTDQEDDLILSLKAAGNTVTSILGGIGTTIIQIGLNVTERTLQRQANQFTEGMARGSNFVGTLYGQGLALKNAYDNEKQLLKEKH